MTTAEKRPKRQKAKRPAEDEELEKLVDDFAEAMKEKLLEQMVHGWNGWRSKSFHEEEIRQRLVGQVCLREVLDPVDIANYAAFLWYKRHLPRTGGDSQ